MKSVETDRSGKIIASIGAIAMFIFSYMIICFFRLDWTRYDTVERSWQVETMLCEKKMPTAVIRLYKKSNPEPDMMIQYSNAMFEHLTKQSLHVLPVERKLVGYLREWDYGTIIPQSIAGQTVDKRRLLLGLHQVDCEFNKSEKTIKTSTDTRRKMR